MPSEPVEEDVYHLDDSKLAKLKIDTLPYSLWQALKELKADKLIQEALGEHMYQRYIEAKTAEWDEFRLHVSDWELNKYLEIYQKNEFKAHSNHTSNSNCTKPNIICFQSNKRILVLDCNNPDRVYSV